MFNSKLKSEIAALKANSPLNRMKQKFRIAR